MKKFAFIALAACVTFVSCNDDDAVTVVDVDTDQTASVDGTWKLTSFEVDTTVDFNGDGTESSNLISETGCYGNSNIVFGQGNMATINMEELELDLQMVVGSENEMEFTIDCAPSTPETAAYAVVGNTVVFTAEGEPQPLVLARAGNTLSVTIPEMTQVPVEGTDGSVTYDFVGATLVWTKQ